MVQVSFRFSDVVPSFGIVQRTSCWFKMFCLEDEHYSSDESVLMFRRIVSSKLPIWCLSLIKPLSGLMIATRNRTLMPAA